MCKKIINSIYMFTTLYLSLSLFFGLPTGLPVVFLLLIVELLLVVVLVPSIKLEFALPDSSSITKFSLVVVELFGIILRCATMALR